MESPELKPQTSDELRQVYPFATMARRISSETGINTLRGGLIEQSTESWRRSCEALFVDDAQNLLWQPSFCGSYNDAGEMSNSVGQQLVKITAWSESSAAIAHARIICNLRSLREVLRDKREILNNQLFDEIMRCKYEPTGGEKAGSCRSLLLEPSITRAVELFEQSRRLLLRYNRWLVLFTGSQPYCYLVLLICTVGHGDESAAACSFVTSPNLTPPLYCLTWSHYFVLSNLEASCVENSARESRQFL